MCKTSLLWKKVLLVQRSSNIVACFIAPINYVPKANRAIVTFLWPHDLMLKYHKWPIDYHDNLYLTIFCKGISNSLWHRCSNQFEEAQMLLLPRYRQINPACKKGPMASNRVAKNAKHLIWFSPNATEGEYRADIGTYFDENKQQINDTVFWGCLSQEGMQKPKSKRALLSIITEIDLWSTKLLCCCTWSFGSQIKKSSHKKAKEKRRNNPNAT